MTELTNGGHEKEAVNGDMEPPAKRPKREETNGVSEDKSRDHTSPEPRVKAEPKKEVS